MQNGAFDYLAKPFDLEQAAALIDRALAHRTPERSRVPVELFSSGQELLGHEPGDAGSVQTHCTGRANARPR